MDLGQQIAVYLGIFLILWYVGASFYNRRFGISTYRWLQPGMKTLGKITEAKWIGSSGSGARLGVAQAKSPFRRVEAAFLLETRELLPLWLINRARGKRDTLFVRAQLRSVPHSELEIVPQGNRSLRNLSSASKQNPWIVSERQLPGQLEYASRGRDVEPLLKALSPMLESIGPSVRRLSIARTSPHLILELSLPPLRSSPSEELFALVTTAFGGSQAQQED